MRALLLAVGLAALSGCSGEPKLDTTSDESVKASMERMTAGMSDDQKKSFAADCLTIAMGEAGKELGKGKPVDPKPDPDRRAQLLKPFHGLTEAQIREKAADVRAKRQPK